MSSPLRGESFFPFLQRREGKGPPPHVVGGKLPSGDPSGTPKGVPRGAPPWGLLIPFLYKKWHNIPKPPSNKVGWYCTNSSIFPKYWSNVPYPEMIAEIIKNNMFIVIV